MYYRFNPRHRIEFSYYSMERDGRKRLEIEADLLHDSPVYAYSFSGVRYDCGSKLGYLEATVAYGLQHEDVGEGFREFLRNEVCS